MDQLYCLKCKSYTQTANPQVTTIPMQYKKGARAGQSINRQAIIGTCATCGVKKQKFIPSNGMMPQPRPVTTKPRGRKKANQTGEGIIGTLLGLPGGQVPVLGQIPLIGALF